MFRIADCQHFEILRVKQINYDRQLFVSESLAQHFSKNLNSLRMLYDRASCGCWSELVSSFPGKRKNLNSVIMDAILLKSIGLCRIFFEISMKIFVGKFSVI